MAWFKFQAKIPSLSGVCIQGEWQNCTPPSPPLSKDQGLKDIGKDHWEGIRNLVLVVNSVTDSCLIHYDSLSQNATDIVTKCDRSFLQNMSGFFLQNATVITYCDITIVNEIVSIIAKACSFTADFI